MRTNIRIPNSQRGVFAVEFALVLLLLLTLTYSVVELARAMYMFNTLQESTRRAASGAAQTDFRNEADKDSVRQDAIFRGSAGTLAVGDPITDAHIRIDYLALTRNADGSLALSPIATSSMPSCPARNRIICMSDPNSASCIRFVRARVCDPSNTGTCNAVQYKPLMPLVDLPINLPRSETIVTAGSLGFVAGATPCP